MTFSDPPKYLRLANQKEKKLKNISYKNVSSAMSAAALLLALMLMLITTFIVIIYLDVSYKYTKSVQKQQDTSGSHLIIVRINL